MRLHYVVALVVFGLGWFAVGFVPNGSATDGTIVAVVNGDPINYAGLEMSPKALLGRFRRVHSRLPATEADGEVLDRDKRAYETGRLVE